MEPTITSIAKERLTQGHETHLEQRNLAPAIPAGAYIAFSLGCCTLGTLLSLSGRRHAGLVLSSWAPVTMLLGLYDELRRR